MSSMGFKARMSCLTFTLRVDAILHVMKNGVEKVYDHTNWSFIVFHMGFGARMPCLAFVLGSCLTSHVTVNVDNSRRYLIL